MLSLVLAPSEWLELEWLLWAVVHAKKPNNIFDNILEDCPYKNPATPLPPKRVFN